MSGRMLGYQGATAGVMPKAHARGGLIWTRVGANLSREDDRGLARFETRAKGDRCASITCTERITPPFMFVPGVAGYRPPPGYKSASPTG